ncbi:MAG: universal stress protein [Candidatus Mariimomonas ferrooxydans]
MGRYRKILVAFDGSESSRNALKQAIKLAETEKSWIKVLAVVPSYEGDLELVGVNNIKRVLEGSSEKLVKEAKEISQAEGVSIITSVEQGRAYEKIVYVADVEDCDIIVMGRSGIHNIERMLMGSVTSRVIGYTRKEVLVVPGDTSIGWGNILLATDDSKCSEVAADRAINFAKSYGGRLTAVSVVDVTDEFYAEVPQAVAQMVEKAESALEKVNKKAESEGIKIESVVREGGEHEKIVEVAEEKGADVIFMGSHGRTGLEKLIMGSITEKVIGYAPCPVMVVKS